jgi:O-antigen/teichoic acid export membrane protein
MRGLKWNLAANIIGAGWSGIIQLACVPLIVKLMGIEAYGLVGFYVMLQASLQILDLGLGPTINRELAKYSVALVPAEEIRDFVRTLEWSYWAIGVIAGLALGVSAPFIAKFWIKPETISGAELTEIVLMMALLVAIQWPAGYYRGGLMGLQRQVLLNGIRIANATLSNVGAVLVVWLLSPTLVAFFLWQIAVSTLNVLFLAASLWRNLPKANRAAHFELKLLKRIRRFAAGMSGITFFGVILSQMDKLVVSKLLDLKEFAYYVLAGVVASSLQLVVTPMFTAIFPRMSALVAMGNDSEVSRLYHDSSQLMAALVLPISLVLVVFSREALLTWTHNPTVAEHASIVVALLVTGTALNGLMNMPYALHLAYGWTSVGVKLTLAKIIVFVPMTIFLARRYGAAGGAASWALLNLAYLTVGPPLIHKILPVGTTWKWLINDIAPPLFLSATVVLLGRLAVGANDETSIAASHIAKIAFVFLVAQIAAGISVEKIRRLIRARLFHF